MIKKMGVILTTYNSPAWLEKVLWGYEAQSDAEFETIIADDGSGDETRDLIERFRRRGRLTLRHVWHADNGFRKTEILNRAIEQTDCDYLMFSDGDCIPRRDVIRIHKRRARPGRFLSAGYFKLTRSVSRAISEADVRSGRAFEHAFLRRAGQPWSFKNLRLMTGPFAAETLNRLSPTAASWNGAQSSTWRATLLRVNGFDTRMRYGGLDRELGERLMNAGVRGIQIRYTAICLHLDHDRGYENAETWARNNAIREHTRSSGLTRTEFGISLDRSRQAA